MKNILIFGGFGFIGTNVIKYIDDNFKDKYNVIVFDKYLQHPFGVKFSSIVKTYSGDFSDEILINKIFVENKVDIVLHLLSSTVPSTSQNAKFDVKSNLISTLNLLSIMDNHKVKDIIYFSSGGAIYGDHKINHSENDPVYPKSSYGIVKLAIERYLLLYAELYGFNSLILRLSNPFGPYHYNVHQGICNIGLKKALQGETIQIWGNGNGKKDYIYIKDVCAILFKLFEDKVSTNVINIGSGDLHSVNNIIENINNLGTRLEFEYIDKSLNNVSEFSLDITRLKNIINDLEFTKFNDALFETYTWTKNQLFEIK